MKYIKLFENHAVHYMKDLSVDEIFFIIEVLKEYHIPYNLYYYIDNYDNTSRMHFKLYEFTSITSKERKILKELDIYVLDEPYTFTWNWIKIEDESQLQTLIDESKMILNANKYNI